MCQHIFILSVSGVMPEIFRVICSRLFRVICPRLSGVNPETFRVDCPSLFYLYVYDYLLYYYVSTYFDTLFFRVMPELYFRGDARDFPGLIPEISGLDARASKTFRVKCPSFILLFILKICMYRQIFILCYCLLFNTFTLKQLLLFIYYY